MDEAISGSFTFLGMPRQYGSFGQWSLSSKGGHRHSTFHVVVQFGNAKCIGGCAMPDLSICTCRMVPLCMAGGVVDSALTQPEVVSTMILSYRERFG